MSSVGRYLKKERQVMGDTAKFIYQWGPRAMSEVDKKALLKMVAEVTVLGAKDMR